MATIVPQEPAPDGEARATTVTEPLFEIEPTELRRRLPARARAHRARVMPLSEFPVSKQREIAEAVAQPKPPSRWLRFELCAMESRAWYEWHWHRGIDPNTKRTSLAPWLRQAVIDRDGMICGLCGEAVEDVADIHIDHIKPVMHGESDYMGNLQVAHSRCNMSKGARL